MENAFSKPWELHPVLVHFPIAFLLGAVAVILWGVLRPSESSNKVADGMLLAGVLSGWLAAAAGGLAYYTVPAHTEFGHVLMFWHLGFALASLTLFTGLTTWRWRSRLSKTTFLQLAIAMLGFALVTVTGHLGGTIVLRNGAGVDPAILIAEVRGGHTHQGGQNAGMEDMPGMNDPAESHDMTDMKNMDGMPEMNDMPADSSGHVSCQVTRRSINHHSQDVRCY